MTRPFAGAPEGLLLVEHKQPRDHVDQLYLRPLRLQPRGGVRTKDKLKGPAAADGARPLAPDERGVAAEVDLRHVAARRAGAIG